jgi:hypothetical protein
MKAARTFAKRCSGMGCIAEHDGTMVAARRSGAAVRDELERDARVLRSD